MKRTGPSCLAFCGWVGGPSPIWQPPFTPSIPGLCLCTPRFKLRPLLKGRAGGTDTVARGTKSFWWLVVLLIYSSCPLDIYHEIFPFKGGGSEKEK